MSPSDKHPMLDDLLTGPEVVRFREASLPEALAVLRRTRRRRKLVRGMAMASLPALLVSLVMLGRSVRSGHPDSTLLPPREITSASEAAGASSVEYISDTELLALFPNQPLALVGPEGRQQLIFLGRPAAN